jgi:GPH family glycoside/pentoside/hexuronide:cation symporter
MTASTAPQPAPGAMNPRHLLSLKWFYGLGSIAFGVKASGFGALLLLYYNQVLGLSPALTGLALGIASLVDAFTDPIIGYASDNLHSRWGRRHPFMYAVAIPGAVAYALLWNPPHLSQTGLFIYLLAVSIIIRILLTCYEIPSTALLPELTTGYDERTSFVSLRVFLGNIGGLVVSMLAFVVFLAPTAQQPVGQLNAAGYHGYGVFSALIIFAAIAVSAIGTHSAIPYLRRPPPKSRPDPIRALRVILTTLGSRSIGVLLVCGILWAIAAGIVGSLGFYMNTYFWELSAQQISMLVLASFLANFLSLALAPPVAKRFGKKATAIGGGIVWCVVGPAPVWLRLLGFFPQPGSWWLLPMLIVFLTIQLSIGVMSAMLVGSMMADVVESAELKTGRRSEGLIASANAFIAKSSSGIGVFASGLLISLIQFPAKAQPHHVPWPTLRNLGLTYAFVLFGFYGVAIVLLGAYNITRDRHAANLAQLAAARPQD